MMVYNLRYGRTGDQVSGRSPERTAVTSGGSCSGETHLWRKRLKSRLLLKQVALEIGACLVQHHYPGELEQKAYFALALGVFFSMEKNALF